MNSTLFLRVASIVSLLFAVGHTLGGAQCWSPPGETDVLRAMRAFRFDVSGVSRSYMDFYLGFGFIISSYLLLQAALLWQLAAIARADAARTRPLIASFALASLASVFLTWRFVFTIPVVFSAVIAASLVAALLVAHRGAR